MAEKNKSIDKKNTKSNSTKKVTKSTSKKTTKSSGVKKSVSTKKTTETKNITPIKKTTAKKTTGTKKTEPAKKTTTKKTVPKKTVAIEEAKITKVETPNEKVASLEDAKFPVIKKDKILLIVGVFMSLLGIVALILSLIANRIIDREYLSDFVVALMIFGSLLIETFGAFILINET